MAQTSNSKWTVEDEMALEAELMNEWTLTHSELAFDRFQEVSHTVADHMIEQTRQTVAHLNELQNEAASLIEQLKGISR